MAKAKIATKIQQELNCWCIEMAMRWPVIHAPATYGQGSVGSAGYMPPMPARDVDADVIGRANRIMSWVKESH